METKEYFEKEMFFSKTNPSFLTLKEGSTFLSKPLFPQGREDVAGSAIAPSGFWSASGACALRAGWGCLRNRIAIICRLAHQCRCLSSVKKYKALLLFNTGWLHLGTVERCFVCHRSDKV